MRLAASCTVFSRQVVGRSHRKDAVVAQLVEQLIRNEGGTLDSGTKWRLRIRGLTRKLKVRALIRRQIVGSRL